MPFKIDYDAMQSAARTRGSVNRRRDHGRLLLLDLRDHFGIT
jgi:aspartyl-tRNA synthetase